MIESATSKDITYLSNKNYLNGIDHIKAAACLVTRDLEDSLPGNVLTIVVDSPELIIIDVLQLFYEDLCDDPEERVSDLSYLDLTAVFGANSQIKPGVVVKRGVIIGDNCTIDSNTTIGINVMIGHDALIGSNCSLQNCIIGNNVIIHPGVKIGQDGFGYGLADGGLKKFPHIGRVLVQDNVEIGSNTTVDLSLIHI